jgi:hypothetical protein
MVAAQSSTTGALIVLVVALAACNVLIARKKRQAYLATFGDSVKFAKSIEVLTADANKTGLFDVLAYDEKSLSPELREFAKANPRGFGYWAWKPFVILKALESVRPGAIVLYADSGCSIKNGREAHEAFREYTEKVRAHPKHRVVFRSGWVEREWTKMDLAEHMGCSTDDSVMASGQIIATFSVWMNTEENKALLRTWLGLALRDGGHFVTDAPSVLPNHPDFKEHRHDQSIFSLLIKTLGAHVLDESDQRLVVGLRRRWPG